MTAIAKARSKDPLLQRTREAFETLESLPDLTGPMARNSCVKLMAH